MGSDAALSRGISTVGFIFGVCQARALPGPILIDLLDHVGTPPDAARALLRRMTGLGSLSRETAGRATVYRMAGHMLARFYTIRVGRTEPAWPGHFQLVAYDLSSQERVWRDRMRAAAHRGGFVRLRPGVLIGFESPESWLRPFTLLRDQLGLVDTGTWAVDVATARRVTHRCWDVETHRQSITATIAAVAGLVDTPPADGWEALRQLQTAGSSAAIIWLDVPRVPVELLPADWPMQRLSQVVDAVAQRCKEPIAAVLQPHLAAHRDAALIEWYSPHDWHSP